MRRLRAAPCADGEQGTIVLWLLGLSVILLFMGGISLDLWRVLSERRALAGIADSAAIAGATGIDEAAFRSGEGVVLDVTLAEQRATASVLGQPDVGALTDAEVAATAEAVTVTLTGAVPLTLMRVLLPADTGDVALQVRATAGPQGR